MSAESVHVLVGLIRAADGRWLVNRRRPGTHMAGFWEFPGGKRRADESRTEALFRELDEELGIRVAEAEPFVDLVHDYAEKRVRLDVWLVTAFHGRVSAREGQELRWVARHELTDLGLLEADRPIVDALPP